MTIPKEAQAREEMTLRELCQALDISRRTVQGYEAHGLVAPSKKTNMGYLIYDMLQPHAHKTAYALWREVFPSQCKTGF